MVCTFKCTPDVRATSEVIRPYLERNQRVARGHPAPHIVLIQNGIDIEEEVFSSLVQSSPPLARGLISGLTWVGVTLLGEGSRIEHGMLEKLQAGLYTGADEPPPAPESKAALSTFESLLKKGGSTVEVCEDIQARRWSKMLWNVSWGGLCVLSRQPVGVLISAEMLPYSCGVVRRIMTEVIAVARASGFDESRMPASLVDHVLSLTLDQTPARKFNPAHPDAAPSEPASNSVQPDFKPSILVYLERQRPMEVDPIFGHLVHRARNVGVETPRLDMIVAVLKSYQFVFVAQQRATSGEAPSETGSAGGVYNVNPHAHPTAGAPVV